MQRQVHISALSGRGYTAPEATRFVITDLDLLDLASQEAQAAGEAATHGRRMASVVLLSMVPLPTFIALWGVMARCRPALSPGATPAG